MDKLLELSFRTIICLLNGEESKANIYKSKALEIHCKLETEKRYVYSVGDHVPGHIKQQLYEMVS